MVVAATAATMGDRLHLPVSPIEVAQWRKKRRQELIFERTALLQEARSNAAQLVSEHLLGFLRERRMPIEGKVISGYWPIKSEFDLRSFLSSCITHGARAALPIVETNAGPLVFREWTQDSHMVRGFWNIPVPAGTDVLVPDRLLSPLVGRDRDGYRLGYGGGYFDRTLAALNSPRLGIGVGLQSACIDTVFPQTHDVKMDLIVTDAGVQWSES